nr:MAG TPA: hypothetical protein [Caudoviricetes sp.]
MHTKHKKHIYNNNRGHRPPVYFSLRAASKHTGGMCFCYNTIMRKFNKIPAIT